MRTKSKYGLRGVPRRRHPSSEEFHRLCDQMKALHDKKSQDYGRATDPFANVRASEAWGFPAWVGCMMRGCDKVVRLQAEAINGKLANESAEDAFMDLAVYSLIGLVLYRESKGAGRKPAALRSRRR